MVSALVDDQKPVDRPSEDTIMRISSLNPKLPAEISVLSVVADMFNLSPHMVRGRGTQKCFHIASSPRDRRVDLAEHKTFPRV